MEGRRLDAWLVEVSGDLWVSPNLAGRILLWCRGEQEGEVSRRKQQGQVLPMPCQLCTARFQGCSGCPGLWLLNSQVCAPLAGHESPANSPSFPYSGSPCGHPMGARMNSGHPKLLALVLSSISAGQLDAPTLSSTARLSWTATAMQAHFSPASVSTLL